MRRLGRSSLIVTALVVFALMVVACGSSSSAPDASRLHPKQSSNGTTITIKNFEFSPSPLRVKVGDTVSVHNTDSTAHTVTANDGSFDTGDIGGGKTASFRVKKAGTVPYHCDIHQFMHGDLTVTG